MIPEAAVEAAVHRSWHLEITTSDVREILEAAAPHMLANVATEEELDALPVGTVVLSDEVSHHEGGWRIAYQRWQDGAWHRGGRAGSTHPDNFLPATVLHVRAPK